jgi:hypothetical protein
MFASICIVTMAASLAHPASAQMRNQLKDRIIDDVANQMVSEIQSDSCPEFADMLKNAKGGGGGNKSKAGGMMKSDPAARQRFINKVAGPLVNKMIDCDMLPGR